MTERRPRVPAPVLVLLLVGLAGLVGTCSVTPAETVVPVDIPAESLEYVVLAWNDIGMHGFSATYDSEVLLPPYNTLWAQVVRRGAPPEIVTAGVRLEYRIVDNTFSYGKRSYAQFWDNSLLLFGTALAPDTGLNFVDPGVHNGLTGEMVLKGNHFQADGIPVVPVNDADVWDPYQVAEIKVLDAATGLELAVTRTTVPTSDEISCAKCHGVGDVKSILEAHDESEETTLVDSKPVLCAACHGSPFLGQTGPGSSGKYLSQAVHLTHSLKTVNCYDCHPGQETKGNRSTDHTNASGNCATCHGTMANLANTITSGRVPWSGQPKCASCHTFVHEVETGAALYKDSAGHGELSCSACHGPAHATVPSNEDSDHYQALQYQNKALTIGSCRVCHSSSKGGGLVNIVTAHGGDRPTSCAVCHTAPIATNNPESFPHRFQWRRR
ncbi:MAG: hypothetical protein FJY79_01195 [Candidatus Aminicenantes bacterium]|nr:hypothetical protein [Candidatus Aminicenantes bacterium]